MRLSPEDKKQEKVRGIGTVHSKAQQHAMLLSNKPLNLHSTVHFTLAKKIHKQNFAYTMYIFMPCQVLIRAYLNS